MPPDAPQLWPIFICYRQTDGLPAARRLHELLDKHETIGPGGERIRLDVYLDQTMPAVANWRALHGPYLEKARALIVVCSPGAKIDEGPKDWVHMEIRWWTEHRPAVAPILIDPLRQGLRYVPDEITQRWGEDIQRVPLVAAEWASLTAAELQEKSDALRRVVIGAIVPSGKTVWQQELEEARARADQLRRRLIAVAVLLVVAVGATAYAFVSNRAAQISRRVSEAALQDARAAAAFDEARRYEARVEALRQQRRDNQLQLNEIAAKAAEDRPKTDLEQNLEYESRQIDEDMLDLRKKAAEPRQRGYEQLGLADASWKVLLASSRQRPEPPAVFSLELINAGPGESILIHFGTPDATRLVMLNSGPTASFKEAVGKRLQALKATRFAGNPTPIELFIASDQDEHKTGGLKLMLRDRLAAPSARDALVELRAVWANLFASSGLRGELRGAIDKLQIPWNEPFDHIVIRPEQGRAVHKLSDGAGEELEIVVLGPERERLRELFEMSREGDRRHSVRAPLAAPIREFPDEQFSQFKELAKDRDSLPAAPEQAGSGSCVPSESAGQQADVGASDDSKPNLASTILLFRYRGKSLLHTGDSRADLIMKALIESRLMPQDGGAHVNVLHIPHLGSNRNLTPEFLERVTADEYLFTGDGTHGNPETGTIAALVAARPCARYIMHFVNRDSVKNVEHGPKMNAFFAGENASNPNYRRFFRSPDGGSVFIDLLDRVTY